ncbi:MAG: SBBP repeat-containing protein [Bryobacteraceae bacterium]|nr:SBBP repeat-containing protein [Bryobacteraceae bacterium]
MSLLHLLLLGLTAAQADGKVRHANVYPGIHLDYYQTAAGTEYDWVVQPGASPARIAMRFPGATAVHIEASGDLTMRLDARLVRHSAPFSYQLRKGRRLEIPSRFVELAPGVIGFETAAYDPALALVIDPVIQVSKLVTAVGNDFGGDFARDAAGNYYIIKDDLTGGPAQLRKLSATGQVLFTRTLAAEFREQFEMKLDPAGNIYIAAMMSACPATTTRVIGDIANGPKMAVAKFLPDGATQAYLLCVQPGGLQLNVSAMAVDSAGQAFVAGRTDSNTFPATGTFGTLVPGQQHLYVFKVNAAGDSLPVSVVTGNGILPQALALDAQGNLLLGGITLATFDLVSPLQPQFGGGNIDGFLMKIRADGLQILFATFLGGSGDDTVSDIAVDGAGNIVIAGNSLSANFPVAGPFARPPAGNRDAFVAKLPSSGASLLFSTMLGGSLGDFANSVAVRPTGEIYVAGETDSPNFPVVRPLQPFRESDAFVTTLDANGLIVFSTFLGGTAGERLPSVILNPDGFAVSGTTGSANFPRVPFFQFSVLLDGSDAFLTVFQEEADLSVGALSRFAAVRNHGPDTAMSVRLSISIPASAVQNQDSRCTVAALATTCQLGTLQPGSLSIPQVAFNSAPTSMTVTSAIFDPNLANNVD